MGKPVLAVHSSCLYSGAWKAERRFWKLCEEWELLIEVRRMLDERRKVGGELVMRPHGSWCERRAWPPIPGLDMAVLELSEGTGGDSRLS